MLIVMYLAAIVAANLLVVRFGPGVSILTALLFIGLDLTARDGLHEKWRGNGLWWRMALLIGAGSVASYIINRNAGAIALASFIAFAAAGITDTIIYTFLKDKSRFQKINGSNVGSAAVDSLVFPVLAFGIPVLWAIVIGQFTAKVLGGLAWALVLNQKVK